MSQTGAERRVKQALINSDSLSPEGTAKAQQRSGATYVAVPVELVKHHGITQGSELDRAYREESIVLLSLRMARIYSTRLIIRYMAQLREFIYIDNNSLNSNLSSLGKGIPSEITQSSENQTEKGGEGGANLPGINAGGKYIDLDREQVQTTLDITAPYRFQDLLDEVKSEDIQVKVNPDPRGLSRSDLVKVEGEVFPMALPKLEMAIDAFETFTGEDFNEALRKLGEDSVVTQQEREMFSALSQAIEQISGNEYPLRIEREDMTYCTTLEVTNMRKSIFEAFSENERYILFGRVKHHIPANKEWNPVHALNILERYVSGEDYADDFVNELRSGSDSINISIEDEDITVQGHTAVIEPIAMYW